MNLFRISSLIGIASNLGLTLFFLFWMKKKHSSLKWFVGFTFSATVWHFGAFVFAACPKAAYNLAFWGWKIAYMGAFFSVAFFFHFIICHLELKRQWIVALVYLFATFFSFFTWYDSSRYFLGDMHFVFDSFYWIDALKYKNPLFFIFYISFFWIVLGYGFFLLLKALKRASGTEHRKLKYLIVAVSIGWIGTNPLFLPAFRFEVYPYSNFLVALYPLFVAYVVIRHKVMDIEVVIKKTLIFTGLFAVAFGVFSGVAYLGSIWFENVIENRWIALVPSVLAIVVILRPLENFLRDITDKFLFQKKYDYKHLIKTFTEEVLTVIEFHDLVHTTVNKLTEILKLDNAMLFLYNEDGEQYQLAAAVLPKDSGKVVTALDENGAIAAYMRKRRKFFLLNGVRQQKFPPPETMKELQKLETALIIPLIVHNDNMIGVLSLGKKKSDEEFTQDDIDVLLPLAKTLSIAMSNATLFKELSKAQARAAQREKMAVIGTLSAGINHEICNPLGIARGQCEMFLLNMAEGVYKGKTQKELLAKAQEIMMKVIHETDRATLITRKLSSFAKPATGEIMDDVSLGKEVKVVISLLEHDLKLDDIVIEKEIPENLPNISADRKQLQEIFFNIIRNAVQSIKGSGEIFIRLSSNGKKVYVEIEDTGVGISKSELDQIFDPFFTTKDPGKGTGLGLYIVKQIIEKNNGKISVQSELKKGTTFLLTFDAI